MGETVHEYAGATAVLSLTIVDEVYTENNPVTGQSPTVAIHRTSDGYWWDFTHSTWVNQGLYVDLTSDFKKVLTDMGDGTYQTLWDQQTADGGAIRTYTMIYEVANGTYAGMDSDVWIFTVAGPTIEFPSPPDPAYCMVFAYTACQDADVPEGTFSVTEIHSPKVYGTGDSKQTIVYDAQSATLSGGYADLAILRGAVVDLELRTTNDVIVKRRRIIPDADYANWEDLETSEE